MASLSLDHQSSACITALEMTPVATSIFILVKIQLYSISYLDSFASEDINTFAFYSIRIALAVGRSDNGLDVINYVSHRDMKMPYCSEWNKKAIGVRTQLDSFKEKEKHGVSRKFHR
jgi:hypothetical protein